MRRTNSIELSVHFVGTLLLRPPQKRKLFFSHTRTQQAAAVRKYFATTVGHYIHWPVCLCSLCSLPARCRQRRRCCCCRCRRRRRRQRSMLVGCLAGCLTLRYRYFCCRLPVLRSLGLWLCVLFDGLAVHSFVRFASACVCFASASVLLPAARCPLPALLRFVSPRLALLCLCFAFALVQLLQLNFSSVQFSIDTRSTFCSAFSVQSVVQCQCQCQRQCEVNF